MTVYWGGGLGVGVGGWGVGVGGHDTYICLFMFMDGSRVSFKTSFDVKQPKTGLFRFVWKPYCLLWFIF